MAGVPTAGVRDTYRALRDFGAGHGLSRFVKIAFIFIALAVLSLSAFSLRGAEPPAGLPPGTWALERAFVWMALASAIVVFRAWERVFPVSIPTLYAMYPLRGGVVAARELQLSLRDALMLAVLTAMWVLPLLFSGGVYEALYGVVYAVVGGLMTGALAFGVPILYVAFSLRQPAMGRQDTAARLMMTSSPAITFGVALVLLLFLKIGLGEYALLVGGPGLDADGTTGPMADNLGAMTPGEGPQAPDASMIVTRGLPRSVLVGLGVPLLSALSIVVFALWVRAHRWLRDMVRVSSSMVVVPELSYAWIDASALASEHLHPVQLVGRRDAMRLHRRAPFRLAGTIALTAFASLLALFASPEVGWVAIALNAAWIVLWLRLPEALRAMDTTALRHWDQLLLSHDEIVGARRLTALRALAPYAVLLGLPTLLFAFARPHLLVWCFLIFTFVVFIAHAVLRRPRAING